MKGCVACLLLAVAFSSSTTATIAAATDRLSGNSQGSTRGLKHANSGLQPPPPPPPPPLSKATLQPTRRPTQKPSTPKPTKSTSSGNKFACGKTGSCFFASILPKEWCDDQPLVCPAKDCNTIRGTYKATEYVIVDVNSFSYQGGPNKPPAVTVAAQCCDACKKNKNCNVWSFCDNDKCGGKGYCTELYNKYPSGFEKGLKRGVYGSACSNGYFSKGSCLLQRYTAEEFKNASSNIGGPDTVISGKIDRTLLA